MLTIKMVMIMMIISMVVIMMITIVIRMMMIDDGYHDDHNGDDANDGEMLSFLIMSRLCKLEDYKPRFPANLELFLHTPFQGR